MFAPDVVVCSAEDVIYMFNKEEVLLEKEVSFTKIPYADHFTCRNYWHIKATESGCHTEYGYYIHFVK